MGFRGTGDQEAGSGELQERRPCTGMCTGLITAAPGSLDRTFLLLQICFIYLFIAILTAQFIGINYEIHLFFSLFCQNIIYVFQFFKLKYS